MKVIQNRLGLKNIKTTMNIYAHVTQKMMKKLATCLKISFDIGHSLVTKKQTTEISLLKVLQ